MAHLLPHWRDLVWVSSCVSVLAGLALAWCAVGALLQDVWRASPRGRFGLVLPLLLLLLIPIAAACFWFGAFGAIPFPLIQLGNFLFFVVLIAHPLITALLLMWVSREARAFASKHPLTASSASSWWVEWCSRCSVDSSSTSLPCWAAGYRRWSSCLHYASPSSSPSARSWGYPAHVRAGRHAPRTLLPLTLARLGSLEGIGTELSGALARSSCACGGVKTRSCQKTDDPSSGVQPFSRKHHTYGQLLHRSHSDQVSKICTACFYPCLFPAPLYTTFAMASAKGICRKSRTIRKRGTRIVVCRNNFPHSDHNFSQHLTV